MSLNYFIAEWKKAKKAEILFSGVCLLFFASLFGLFTYFANRQVLIDGQQAQVLWGQLVFFYSLLFFPPMVAIIVSLIFMPEFERKTLEMLLANNISRSKLLLGKIAMVTFFVCLFQFFVLLIYIVAAKISSLDSQLLLSLHIKWTLFSIVGALPVISLQCYFCIRTKNFSKCVATSILGVFGTMILLFVNEDFLVIYPYAQPSLALRARALVDYSSFQWGILLIICIVESTLFFILSLRQLK